MAVHQLSNRIWTAYSTAALSSLLLQLAGLWLWSFQVNEILVAMTALVCIVVSVVILARSARFPAAILLAMGCCGVALAASTLVSVIFLRRPGIDDRVWDFAMLAGGLAGPSLIIGVIFTVAGLTLVRRHTEKS